MVLLAAIVPLAMGQSSYHVVAVSNPGTIAGTVKWSGPAPRLPEFPITKDPQVCDPASHKKVDLERLLIGPQGGVANTIVYLKDVTSGKAMDIPQPRRFLDQKQCRYEPHILLVPSDADIQMKSSDAVLHTVHMDGAATFNLPFPFINQVTSRKLSSPGLINLKCNGGHVWMNAEVMVVPHPYYVVTDKSGRFELTGVPPGEYEIVAWHEGWSVIGQQHAFDVLTQVKVERPLFSEPRVWTKKVGVQAEQVSTVNFAISEK